MKMQLCIYSPCGSVLVHYRDTSQEDTEIDIDFVQLYRFIHSCFRFSKCNYIASRFNGLDIIAIDGSLSCIVSIATLNKLEQEFICNILLYCFERAYYSELQQINNEETKLIQNKMQNYTVHDIDQRHDKIIKHTHFAKFVSFQYIIRKLIDSSILNKEIITNISNHNPSDFGLLLINSENSIIFEYFSSYHIICNEMKQFIFKNIKHKTMKLIKLKTWNGIWKISRCAIKMWCDSTLFIIEKHSHKNSDNNNNKMIKEIRNHFESLMIGHNAEIILKHIEKLKQDSLIHPKPPSLKQKNWNKKNGKRPSLSRKIKYEKQIEKQNVSADELNVLVIPNIALESSRRD